MIDWIKRKFGRGSKVDMLIRALPNPDTIMRGAKHWSELTRDWGDRLTAWEPQESALLDVIRATADAADLLGPMIGNDVIGSTKRAAMIAQLRVAAAGVGIADEAFDRFWLYKARPLLDAYITRLRA